PALASSPHSWTQGLSHRVAPLGVRYSRGAGGGNPDAGDTTDTRWATSIPAPRPSVPKGRKAYVTDIHQNALPEGSIPAQIAPLSCSTSHLVATSGPPASRSGWSRRKSRRGCGQYTDRLR